MAKTIREIEPGLYQRLNPKTGIWGEHLWYTTTVDSKTRFLSTKTTHVKEARKIRALAVAAAEQGTPAPKARFLVAELLERVIAYHEKNRHASLVTARGHVKSLTAVLGTKAVRDLRTVHIEAMQTAWQAQGIVSDVTINRRCQTLRLALNLAHRAGDLPNPPHVPMLKKAKGKRGLYINGGDHALLSEYLPDYAARLFDFARLFGIRKGQLSRTHRMWVSRERAVIEYPPDECKNDDPHTVPLDEVALELIDRLLADQRPWCPFLFHGPRCRPGRVPHKIYGCVGDFKKAWDTACRKAGMPVGRKQGGYTFHHTRNTFATDFIAGGGSVEDAMAVGNWKTRNMVSHYNLGNVKALRERLAASRSIVQRLDEDVSGRARERTV